MCGIVGVLQYESEMDRTLRKKALKILFTETMLKTEPRGDDATGLYQVHADGDWMLTKKGEKVTSWLNQLPGGNDPAVYQDFVDTWDKHPFEMTALVGHCRKATVGSKGKNNDDNHPFAVQVDERNAILGIHNGTLYNHEIIFEKLKELANSNLVRQGSVDSEAIFHMMYHVTENGTQPVNGDMLQYMGKRLDGAYSCIVVNSKFPHQVVTFRDGRPMEYFMIAPLNIVLIASDKKFVESAIEKYEFIRRWTAEGQDLPELHGYNRNLLEKDYRIFDLTKPFPKKVDWNAFDEISEKGVMLKSLADLDKNWKKQTAHSFYSSSSTSASNSKPVSCYKGAYQPPTFKANTTKQTKSSTGETNVSSSLTAADKENGAELAVVSAEIKTKVELGNEAEAKMAFQKAKLLGLCPAYDMLREVSQAIGQTESQLKAMELPELATKIGQAHFNMGYAVARVDSRQEIEEIRKKAREQHSIMEKGAEKQKRAQAHIWELKQIIVLSMALAESKYPISLRNIEIVLDGYTKHSSERKADIMVVAKSLFQDQSAEKEINELVAEFTRPKKKTTKAKSEEEE